MDKFKNFVSATGKKYDFGMILPIRKVEEQSDGTLRVYGVVTAEKPDRDKEVCNYSKTVPYYKKTVAEMLKATNVEGMEQSIMPLREMHQLNAVGKGISINFLDEEKTIYMGFEVVAAETIKKVKKGVLPAFSQGGNYAEKPIKSEEFPGCMEYVADPGEVSLVDRGSLPEALIDTVKGQTFSLHKRDGSVEIVRCDEVLAKEVKYLVPGGKHLPYTDESGKPSHSHMGAAWAALHGGYRGNKYEGPGKEEAIHRLTELYHSEGIPLPTEKALQLAERVWELTKLSGSELDTAIREFNAAMNEMMRQQSAAKGDEMTTEQIAKCAAALGITPEEFSKQFIDGPNFDKAAKGLAALHGHLGKAMEHHEEMMAAHEKMGKAHAAHSAMLGKCMKACKDVMGSDGEAADKALKALLADLVKADDKKGDDSMKTEQIQEMIKAALAEQAKAFDEKLGKQLASDNGGTGVRLALVSRDGTVISKGQGSNAPGVDPFGDAN